MRLTDAKTEREQIEFSERAAKAFAADPKLWSFSDAEVQPGCLLALRWGLGDDCVLTMRLDEFHQPTVYGQLVKHVEG